jgi:hypothetical protein
MAISTLTYGYENSGSSQGFALVQNGFARAYTENAVTQHLWAVAFHGRVGKVSGTNADFRFGLWQADSSKEPDARVGYSSERTASTLMDSGSTGSMFDASVVIADDSPSNSAIQLWSGTRYSPGILVDDADAYVGMIFASSITKDTELLYQKIAATSGTVPPEDFGSVTTVTAGHLTIWLECHDNEAPRVPVDRSPSGAIETLTPTFTSTFRDRNGTWGPGNDGYDDGDEIKRYRIQVRRVSDNLTMWAPAAFSASSTEKSGDSTTRLYAGSTLVRGTAYEWRIQHQDMFDAWGDYSDWLEFTPSSSGYVFTNASSPSGKQEVNTGITFGGSWTHQSSLQTNAVTVQLKENGTVVRTSPTITKTVSSSASPGTAFTVTWAQTAFEDLDWGHAYTYAINARDTANNWSGYSDDRAFNINAAPAIPSNLTPTGGAVSSSYPLLTCTTSDPDSDDIATALTVTGVITKPDTTTVSVTLTYNSTTGKFEFQTTSTQIPAVGTYSWTAYAYDGTLYSGDSTTSGGATHSDASTFVYTAGPTVTITSPTEAEVIDTITPTVTWSVSGGTQTKYRIKIYKESTGLLVYDSTLLVSVATSQEIPPAELENEEDYTMTVEVEDATATLGTSTVRSFSVEFDPIPELTNFQATPIKVGTDTVETAIRLTWDASIEPAPFFVRYILRRSDLERPLAYIDSQSTTAYTDYLPVSDVEYEYTIRQVNVYEGVNVASPTVSAEAAVSLDGVVLCSTENPSTYRTVLSFGEKRSHKRSNNDKFYLPWSATKPTTVRGLVSYWDTSATYNLITDVRIGVTALTRLAEIEDLIEYGGTLCYRDERGRKRFVTIETNGLGVDDLFPERSDVTLNVREEAFDEGVLDETARL